MIYLLEGSLQVLTKYSGRFLAFGVGLDPRQQKLFGMFIGPLAVGCAVGLVSFASAGLVPGYTGTSVHPARCFAFAIGRGDFAGMVPSVMNGPRSVLSADGLSVNRSMDLVGWTRRRSTAIQRRIPNRSTVPQ